MMTRFCVCCDAAGEMVPFTNETHAVTYRDQTRQVGGLSGMRCNACGEIEYDQDSAERYATAGDALVMGYRQQEGQELRRIRKKLKLNQTEASRLTGGGHNAFSRYETGRVAPAPAVLNLFRLLERHPEDLNLLKQG